MEVTKAYLNISQHSHTGTPKKKTTETSSRIAGTPSKFVTKHIKEITVLFTGMVKNVEIWLMLDVTGN
jgi:hypothetical protein